VVAGDVLPLIRTPRDLAEALARSCAAGAEALAAARQAVQARTLAYPLGAGEAEVIAVVAGIKPMLRQTLAREQADAAVGRYAHLGLAALVRSAADNPRARHGEGLVYLGRDARRLAEAAAAEAGEDDVALGELLGYPRCCVAAFMAATQPRTCASVLHANWRGFRGEGAAVLNGIDLRVFHYASWQPCSPDCAPSRRYAEAVRGLVGSSAAQVVTQARRDPGMGRFVAAIDRAQAAHRLHVLPGVQLSIAGDAEGEAVRVRHAWATAVDRHPGFPMDADEVEATARLVLRIAAGVAVRVYGQVLEVDGVALLRAPLVFMTRFASGAACGR
jgi:hypothetical protein